MLVDVKNNNIMQRVRVSREEILSDLDRVRTSIDSSPIRVTPTDLKVIKDKCVNGLRKLKYKNEKLPIDEMALKIVVQEGIPRQPHVQPVRYVPTILTYIVWGGVKCD